MRTFFALEPAPQDKLKIDNWRQKALPDTDKKIAAANFHLTLAFVGDTQEKQLEQLCQMAAGIQQPGFALQFEHCGYFSKPGIFWLGCEISQELHSLASTIQQGVGLSVKQQKHFVPHISLYRGCETPPPAPLFTPEFNLRFEHFALYQSIRDKHGVHYHCVEQWPLLPVFKRG